MAKTSAELLEHARSVANHPFSTAENRSTAIQVAYDLGFADGKLEGAKHMGDSILATMGKSS
jgi:hypothetical protein